jgi:hypothetical protein
MKTICFIEMEGILLDDNEYKADIEKTKDFSEKLINYFKENNIEFYLLSGHHEKIAKEKFENSYLKDLIPIERFIFVDDNYIQKKEEQDKQMHLENLEKDENYKDSYFKQVFIQEQLLKKNIDKKNAVLLCKDIWVDGYYTSRFSKIDFALFKNNLLNKGVKTQLVSGLIYYDLDIFQVKELIENFPVIQTYQLEKIVNEEIRKKLLENTDFSGLIKKRNPQ